MVYCENYGKQMTHRMIGRTKRISCLPESPRNRPDIALGQARRLSTQQEPGRHDDDDDDDDYHPVTQTYINTRLLSWL